MLTVFNDDGSVDIPGNKAYAERLIKKVVGHCSDCLRKTNRRMRMKKTVLMLTLFCLLIAGTVSVFAKGSKEQIASAEAKPEKLTVALVLNTSDYKTVAPLVREWSEKSGIKVEIIEENTQTYASTYVLASKTQNPRLDLIMFWDFYIDQLYSMLTPLDGSYDPALDLKKIDDGDLLPIGISNYNGHPYVFPEGLDTRCFFYRTDLLKDAGFDNPPETWDELVAYAQALTKDLDGDGNIDQWGFASIGFPGQVFNTYTFFDFLIQNNGKIADANGKPLFNSKEGIEALQFMVDLRNKYKVMPPDVITYDNNEIHEGFLSGKFAMINHWPYIYGMVTGSAVEGKVAYARVPRPKNGTHNTVLNAWGFGIPVMSENKKAAWDLATFLISTEAGAFEFSKRNDWPFRKSAYELAAKKYEIPEAHQKFSKFLFNIVDSGAQHVMLKRGSETSQILSEYIDAAMVGKMSAREALEKAASEMNALFE
jgi:multiple sugar transport system substrate-binding protein